MPLPGTILAVHTNGLAGELIRFGSALLDMDSLENHIAVFSHVDDKGVPWCIEGRPGGVGWQDARSYLNSVFTITNRRQPLITEVADPAWGTRGQHVVEQMKAMLGTAYDWRAIFEDGANDLHIPDPWEEKWKDGTIAGHVVCSSSAVIAYRNAGLAYPTYEDAAHIQPGDWTDFILRNHYE